MDHPFRNALSLVLVWLLTVGGGASLMARADDELRVALFQADATPPIGSALCNGGRPPAKEITTPLSARGLVLLGAGDPIVLCAFDWVGIANESHDFFRESLAVAVGTTPDRVTVHTLHQHDAPGTDFATERLLEEQGLGGKYSNPAFDRDVIARLAVAAGQSVEHATPVTHVGVGAGIVEKVASNRRILGADGKVAIGRMSASRNQAAQAAPEGTVDPLVRMVALWNGEQPIVVLTYYATHPQSYYGQGAVNWDFVGIARALREVAVPGTSHIHFDGAGGNVAAGKYNDGSPDMRPILAERLATGMKRAWEAQRKTPVSAADVRWGVAPAHIPVRDTLHEESLRAILSDSSAVTRDRIVAARHLTFLRRRQSGAPMEISCLRIGPARILHLPGELFVEYQLAAQQMRPDQFVAMAAYGDYGTGYIGTEIAYSQGGYEVGYVSRVAPHVEGVLLEAIRQLLQATDM